MSLRRQPPATRISAGWAFALAPPQRLLRFRTCITSLPYDFLSDGIAPELSFAEKVGFDLVQLKDLPREYQQTLRSWIENLLHAGQATRVFTTGYRA